VVQNQAIIYCDGACSGNPGPGGWGSIIIFSDCVVELGGYQKLATNNQMEILAAIKALEYIYDSRKKLDQISIYTDSNYLINAITKWIYGWTQNNWITTNGDPVKNEEIFKVLLNLVNELKPIKIDWQYVPGHQGILGNERVDQIAVSFSRKEELSLDLFHGSIETYPFTEILSYKHADSLEEKSSIHPNPSSSKKLVGYLALVSGQVSAVKTWNECSKLTQGRAGAKYRKFTSRNEALAILSGWKILASKAEMVLNDFYS